MFGRLARWSFVPASAYAVVACVGSPPPPPFGGDGSGTTGDSGTTGSLPVTTSSAEDTRGTGTSSDGDTSTSTGTDETTSSVGPTSSSSTATTEGGESSTEGSESSTDAPPPMCTSDDECPSNQICAMGGCVDACGGAWGLGTYGPCLNEYGSVDDMGLCGANHDCLVDDFPSSASACRVQLCVDACDCPAPPMSGNAVVTCADITQPDDATDCYLSCAEGETCPNGMMCFAGYVCMTPVAADVPVYGNCGGLVPDCAAPGFCLDDGNETVCQMDCVEDDDCPPAPPTGNAPVTCGLANASNPDNECYLDCGNGETCPIGMDCTNGYICAFL